MGKTSRELLSTLEDRMVTYTGPIGKFIVNKQLKDLKLKDSDISNSKLQELIKRSVQAAVYDPKKRSKITKELMKEFCS